jgi:predicted transcriptional regulator
LIEKEIAMSNSTEILEMAADIVAAYVSNNTISVAEVPTLIQTVHQTLSNVTAGVVVAAPVELAPAVPVKKSITAEYLICLEDGKKFKSLKRHLRTRYNMSPDEYRTKWGLPADYPMVAPNYAKARSELAKKMGLGQSRRG